MHIMNHTGTYISYLLMRTFMSLQFYSHMNTFMNPWVHSRTNGIHTFVKVTSLFMSHTYVHRHMQTIHTLTHTWRHVNTHTINTHHDIYKHNIRHHISHIPLYTQPYTHQHTHISHNTQNTTHCAQHIMHMLSSLIPQTHTTLHILNIYHIHLTCTHIS